MNEDSVSEVLSAGVSEGEDGSGMALVFVCSLREPDEQDIASGMDTYCLVTADQAAAYGVVAEEPWALQIP